MKRPDRDKPKPEPYVNPGDARSIDEQYGLEPVIDLGLSVDDGGAPGGVEIHGVECPYCGEHYETSVDTSSGSAHYVEDCQICCQPIEFSVEVDHAGVLQGLTAQRG